MAMTRVLLCSACILICLLTTSIRCQEDGENEDKGYWDRLAEIWKEFYDTVSNVFKKAWNDFTAEIKARVQDFGGWTEEAWDSFKQRMRDWVDERNDIDSYEKSEMRKYIERLQMPEGEKD